MSNEQLEVAIESAWENRDAITPATQGETREAIEDTLNALDSGSLRVAQKLDDGSWHVNQWAKKAVLLGFRIKDMEIQTGGPQGGGWWDKVDSKFVGWGENQWKAAGFRAVPNCVVRKSAFIAPGVVLMPSFVNLGAYVDEGTMVDTWATVGSCAQIGKNVHLSGAVGIGCPSINNGSFVNICTKVYKGRHQNNARCDKCGFANNAIWNRAETCGLPLVFTPAYKFAIDLIPPAAALGSTSLNFHVFNTETQ